MCVHTDCWDSMSGLFIVRESVGHRGLLIWGIILCDGVIWPGGGAV